MSKKFTSRRFEYGGKAAASMVSAVTRSDKLQRTYANATSVSPIVRQTEPASPSKPNGKDSLGNPPKEDLQLCQAVTSRDRWIGLLTSLGARQIGGVVGEPTGALAFVQKGSIFLSHRLALFGRSTKQQTWSSPTTSSSSSGISRPCLVCCSSVSRVHQMPIAVLLSVVLPTTRCL